MQTKIVRITRHEADAQQLTELSRIYGEIDVLSVNESLPGDAKSAVIRFDEIVTGAEVVEAVLPVNLLEAILKFSAFAKNGGSVIRAVMNRTTDSSGNALFTFSHYEKVVKVEVVTERL
jgi:hypothetical protein